jgi:hypothetical protein
MNDVAKRLLKEGVGIEKETNRIGDDLSKQIVLLNSGALGVLVVSANITLDLTEKILMTITIGLISVSLIAIVLRFIQGYLLFSKTGNTLRTIRKTIEDLKDDSAGHVVSKSLETLPTTGGYTAFWISVVSFLLAALSLSAFILVKLW